MVMPRRPREEVEGGINHVYARGNDRQAIYLDELDRRIYLSLLGRVVFAKRWRCLAYCLMNNHVHLLIETSEPNLGAGIQRLHGRYAQTHNARHGRSGHLFQGRFGVTRVTSDEQLWTTVRYIVRNPVEGGMCSRPDDWPWSSHRATVRPPRPPWLDADRLLSYFEASGGPPLVRYADFVRLPRVM